MFRQYSYEIEKNGEILVNVSDEYCRRILNSNWLQYPSLLKWWWKASVFFREIFDVILDSFFVSVIFWFLLTITTVVFLDNTVMSQKLLIVRLLIVFKTRRQLLLACLRQHQKGLLLLLCWLHSLLYQKKIESSRNKCVSWKCFKFCLMANIFGKL